MSASAHEVVARAKRLISERKYQDAVRACRRVLLTKPDEVEVRLLLGQALLALGRHDEVRIEMIAQAKRTPSIGAVYRLLGEAHIRGGERDEAVEALRAALRIDPGDLEARDLLEECGDVDGPPRLETIDRWFAGGDEDDEETLPNSKVGIPQEPTRPATAPAGQAPPSVQLDLGYVDDLEGVPTSAAATPFRDEEMPGAPTAPSAHPPPYSAGLPPAPARPSAGPPPSMPRPPGGSPAAGPPGSFGGGIQSISSSGGLPAPPGARSVAPPPPGAGRPGAAPPPAGMPKNTMRGLGGSGGLSGPPRSASAPAGIKRTMQGLGGPSPFGGGAPDPFAAPGRARIQEAVETLDSDILELEPDSMTSELPAKGGAFEELDEGLPPLEGEATIAREPAPSAPLFAERRGHQGDFDDDAQTSMLRPGDDYEAPTQAGKRLKASATPHDELEATMARPAISEFPSDSIGGMDTGLPPLEGEATQGRAPPELSGGFPVGFDQAPPGFAPTSRPGTFDATAPPPSQPGGRPGPTQRPPAPKASGRKFRLGGRKPILLFAGLGVAALLLVAIGGGVRWYLHSQGDEDVVRTIQTALGDGSIAQLEGAIAAQQEHEAEGPIAFARISFLRALLAFEEGNVSVDELATALAAPPEGADTEPATQLARAYLALTQGDVNAANQIAQALDPQLLLGEAGLLRARVAAANGDFARAKVEAEAATRAQPGQPRPAAALARFLARSGELDDADQALIQIANTEASAIARLAQLELRVLRNEHRAVLGEAEEILGAIGSGGGPFLVGRAKLVFAEAAAASADRTATAAWVDAIQPAETPVDEDFALRRIEALRTVGLNEEAAVLLESLPERVIQASRRSMVSAEVYLANSDYEAVERVLEGAGDSPQTSFLRGRLSEAKGEADAAITHYEAALADPAEFFRASVRLGLLKLRGGNAQEAVARLEPARQRQPSHVDVVTALVEAHLGLEQVTEALRVVQGATDTATDPRVQMARARVDLARGQPEAALSVLSSLAETRPDDAEVHATLGSAAMQSRDFARARTAFDRAIELEATNRIALLGKVALAAREMDASALEAATSAATGANLSDPVLEAAGPQLQVLRGGGHDAGRALQPLVRAQRSNVVLALYYAISQVQAENRRGAQSSLRNVLRADETNYEAHMGTVYVHLRQGSLSAANTAIENAQRHARAQNAGDAVEARIIALRARFELESGRLSRAEAKAREAIEKDANCADAHYVLGVVAIENGGSPTAHFRRALAGTRPPSELFSQLAIYDSSASDRCELIQRYFAAAPSGIDARELRADRRRCR